MNITSIALTLLLIQQFCFCSQQPQDIQDFELNHNRTLFVEHLVHHYGKNRLIQYVNNAKKKSPEQCLKDETIMETAAKNFPTSTVTPTNKKLKTYLELLQKS